MTVKAELEQIAIAALLVFVAGPASAQIPALPSSLSYQAAVARAIAMNPAIAAARLRRPIALASRAVNAERLNPEFHVEFAKETPKEGYTLAVPWELGGKRARRIAVGDAAILTADAEVRAAIAAVEAQVRRTYFQRFIAENRRSVLIEIVGLAIRARDAAKARFETGDVPRLELVQAELVLADAENQTAAAAGAVTAARASLNALLGYPLDAAPSIDTALDLGPELTADAAIARARQANAEIAVLDRRIDEQRARIALAQSLRRPDLTPEGTLTRRAEPEFSVGWRAALAITLPLFTTHTAGVTLEQATLTQLTAERDATLARIAGEVTAATAIAVAQRQQFIRYRDEIAPQALEVERMASDAYRLGQSGISAYLQALQSSRDIRLRAIQAAADLENAIADLELAIGAPLTPGTP